MSGKQRRRERQQDAEEQAAPGRGRSMIAVAIIVAALGAAAVVAVVAFGSSGKVEKASAPVAARQAAGRFRTVLANGRSFSGRDLVGEPTVAAFVIEDCSSCVKTLQTLDALHKGGVRTVAINVNVPPGRNPVTAATSLASFARVVHAGDGTLYAADPGQRTAGAFGIRQIESFLIFDARGREVGHGIGLSANQIRSALNRS